jgi:RsiW-degrading membrane proteinase PrsW (M82 family)
MMMGAFAIPISLVIFFFETNAPRNVSIYQVIKLMLTGGVLALLATLLISTVIAGSTANVLGALLIGVAEETGKVLALMLVINKVRYRWTLNGLLFGSAVGAGFAGFESAGYSFGALLQNESAAPMLQSIVMRGLLAPGGHIVWTGLCGAALWKVKGNERFRTSMLQDMRFLRVFGLAIVLHGMWDMPINLPFFLKYIALTIIAWIAVLSFIQDGLKQLEAARSQQGSGGGLV